MAYKPGDEIDYKLKPGRGRPQKGIVIIVKDDEYVVQSSREGQVTVPTGKVLGLHTKRYTERQRRLL